MRSRHYEYYQDGYWHFEAESDLARIQRQQAFIKKMIKKAEGEFTNPLALNASSAASPRTSPSTAASAPA